MRRPLIAVLAAATALLAGCQPGATITHLRGRAMGTTFSIKVVIPDAIEPPTVRGRIDDALAKFDDVFSTYDPKSEISRFNAHRSHEPFAPSGRFLGLVVRAMDLAKRTAGAFDPTVGPVLRLYGFGPGAKLPEAVPSAAAIDAARRSVGWQMLHVGKTGDLLKGVPGLELDLNAIAKGAGVDVVAGTLDEIGCASYMVEIGGEVRCRGRKPDGEVWRLGVAMPAAPRSEFADEVDLLDRAMATSGSYQQFRDIGKRRVHHIVDPRTGRNADSNVVSVTVIADTCELADGLATALMVLGPDAGEKVLAGFAGADLKALFLIDSGRGIERRGYRW